MSLCDHVTDLTRKQQEIVDTLERMSLRVLQHLQNTRFWIRTRAKSGGMDVFWLEQTNRSLRLTQTQGASCSECLEMGGA